MPLAIDYCFAPNSPWTWLGHERFAQIAKAANASIRVRPIDLGKIFPLSGGLPLAKRAPQRQAYRLVELRRFAEHLGVPLNVQPAFFPTAPEAAAKLIVAVEMHDGTDAAMALAGALLRACWAEQRDLAAASEHAALLAVLGLPARRLDDALSAETQAGYDANTQFAIDTGVFGAPSYVIDGEIFWGQDRLDFVARRLARG